MKLEMPKSFSKLEGKTIASVRWLGDADMAQLMWYKRPVQITFTDGSFIIPQMDDEGNDGGALYFQDEKDWTLLFTEQYHG